MRVTDTGAQRAFVSQIGAARAVQSTRVGGVLHTTTAVEARARVTADIEVRGADTARGTAARVRAGLGEWLGALRAGLWPPLFFGGGAAGLVGLAHAGSVPVVRTAIAAVAALGAYGLGAALAAAWRVAVARTRLDPEPWAGPARTGALVALLPVLGHLVAAGQLVEPLFDPPLWLLAGSAFGTAACVVVLRTLGRVETDRRARQDTVAVHHGRRPAVVLAACFAAVGLGESALFVASVMHVSARHALPGLLLWAFGVGATALCLRLAWPVARDGDAAPAIAWSLRAFVALHAGEAAVAQPALALVGLALLAGLELSVRCRGA